MKIDLYHLYRSIHFTNFGYPLVLGVLGQWARSAGWEVRTAVCREEKVDLETAADVVGISVYTQTAPAAYRLSDSLRRRGTIVILGGPHFRGPETHEEGARHCDAVVGSICEEQWRALLDEIAGGGISPGRGKPSPIVDEGRKFRYPEDLCERTFRRKWYQFPSVPTSLGCPYDCSFCSPYMQGSYHLREIETIRREVGRAGGKGLMLCDATFGLNKEHTLELMRALAPLKKRIMVETTLGRLRDRDVLRAMARGGVKWIIAGVETLGLKMRKHGSADVEETVRQVVSEAHDLGMIVQGNVICGLDSDGPESFDRIRGFYETSGLDLLMAGILTPYPNTRLFRDLQREGRIIDTDWEHYDCQHVVYRPLRMSVDELVDGYLELSRTIHGGRSLVAGPLKTYLRGGVHVETLVAHGFRLYSWYDSRRKRKVLHGAGRTGRSPAGVVS